jgi:hypothetical protein
MASKSICTRGKLLPVSDDRSTQHSAGRACGGRFGIPPQQSTYSWPLVLGLAAALTFLSGGVLTLLTGEFEFSAEPWGYGVLCGCFFSIALPVAAYVCGLLDCVLASAVVGEVKPIGCADLTLGLTLKRGINWIACFLAGPVVPADAGVFYWMHCGDPAFLDWVVLTGLLILTVGYWLFALVALHRRDRLLDVDPVHVVSLISRLGYRSVIVSLGASLLVAAHGWLALGAIASLHRDGVAIGAALLACCWVSGVFWAIFLLRLLGIWCHRARDGIQEPPVEIA